MLKELCFNCNSLTNLDLSHNSQLEMLWVYDSSLTDLNLENNPAMQELDIYSTPISSLRLHEKTPKLTWIRCQDTKLAQLNLSGAENLRMLLCSKSLLTSLGKNGSWTQESDGTLTVRASGPLDKFTGLQVDGKPVAPENYTAVSGSTVITLKKRVPQNALRRHA